MRVKANKHHPLSTSHQHIRPLAMAALFAAVLGLNPIARAQDVPTPISGALGQVQSVGDNSVTIQNKSGLFHINITKPLTTYKVVPSDLNHITDNDYIGVASTQAAEHDAVCSLRLNQL
jgi:hypothetical protein